MKIPKDSRHLEIKKADELQKNRFSQKTSPHANFFNNFFEGLNKKNKEPKKFTATYVKPKSS